MEFKCHLCTAEFYYKRYLAAHLARKHNVKKGNSEFTCWYCKKQYVSKNSLLAHNSKYHNVKKLTVECKETDCSEKFRTVCELRHHLLETHSISNIENFLNLEYQNFTDFSEWLAEEEKTSNAKYIIATMTNYANYKYILYNCNRSGKYKPKIENRQKQLKAQGTMKLGFHCTSALMVKEFSDKVLVTYYPEHYKHEKALCHLPIPDSDKEIIAGKLLQGVGQKTILNDIRESVKGTIERKHLITRKDLHNIKRDFGIRLPSKGSVMENDEISVKAWVDEVKFEESNPVLFYKRQDEIHTNIDTKDFLLVLMTPFQKTMLSQLGGDRICLDSTHGISGYDFELVTILVFDEYEEGVPVAFCITSTINTANLMHFFNCVKTAISDAITPKIFMSDDAIMFKNAWVKVFGPCEKFLLCPWHVDRAWKENLFSLEKEIQGEIYKKLKTLMYEYDENQFQTMLQNFRDMLEGDKDVQIFSNYFIENYFKRAEMWAYCYRKNARINTNMHIENFHRLLKHVYLDGKKIKRVDIVISELMKLVNEKNFEHYIKAQKEKNDKNFRGPLNSHYNSLTFTDINRTEEINNEVNDLESIKAKISNLCTEFNSMTSIDKTAAIQIERHISAIEHLGKIKSKDSLPTVRNSDPSNKKILPQKRFYLVKKQWPVKKRKLAKPSSTEANKKRCNILQEQLFISNIPSIDHN